jgi:ubiquinone/menaquinone biosynthesis C-methylase UbiE
MSELAFTGERFVPGAKGEIWIEHWHRYHFAARWCQGKRVLDVACGEGYGTALLARRAAHVTGADISAEAIAHARSRYGSLANAEFLEASCTALPLDDASVDVAI